MVAFRDDVGGVSARLVEAVTDSRGDTPALTSRQGDPPCETDEWNVSSTPKPQIDRMDP